MIILFMSLILAVFYIYLLSIWIIWHNHHHFHSVIKYFHFTNRITIFGKSSITGKLIKNSKSFGKRINAKFVGRQISNIVAAFSLICKYISSWNQKCQKVPCGIFFLQWQICGMFHKCIQKFLTILIKQIKARTLGSGFSFGSCRFFQKTSYFSLIIYFDDAMFVNFWFRTWTFYNQC